MVTTLAPHPTFAPEHARSPEVLRTAPQSTPIRRVVCPRCGSMLRINYDEPQCLPCGYVDYAYTAPAGSAAKSVISTATRHILRYVGDFPALSETLTHVRLRRLRNRVVYDVRCPFCDTLMEQSSLSGKRREIREERYKCKDGHRVSLTPTGNGSLGWK